jgi:hypothetical protein
MRALIAAAFVVCLVAAGCRRSPEIAYARQLERAASWASSVAFTTELAGQRKVPAHFVDEVMSTAVKEVRTIEADITARDEVDETARRQAADWCGRLKQLIEQRAASPVVAGATEIREIEQRLRTAARAARARRTPESRR